MTSTRALRLGLPVAFAAATIALGAAQACGPMDGGSGGGAPQAGAPQGGGSPGGGSSQGSSGGGGRSWGNAGGESMRQGAQDAARGDLGDDGSPRRSSGVSTSSVPGAASADYTAQISSLGAADAGDETRAAPGAPADAPRKDDPEGVLNWFASAKAGGYDGTWSSIPAYDDPYYQQKMATFDPFTAPWWQKGWVVAQIFMPKPASDAAVTDKGTGGAGYSTYVEPDWTPTLQDPSVNPAWKDWIQLPWYQRLITDEPQYRLGVHPRARDAPAEYSGVRG